MAREIGAAQALGHDSSASAAQCGSCETETSALEDTRHHRAPWETAVDPWETGRS
jgi:hypothetical protein